MERIPNLPPDVQPSLEKRALAAWEQGEQDRRRAGDAAVAAHREQEQQAHRERSYDLLQRIHDLTGDCPSEENAILWRATDRAESFVEFQGLTFSLDRYGFFRLYVECAECRRSNLPEVLPQRATMADLGKILHERRDSRCIECIEAENTARFRAEQAALRESYPRLCDDLEEPEEDEEANRLSCYYIPAACLSDPNAPSLWEQVRSWFRRLTKQEINQ